MLPDLRSTCQGVSFTQIIVDVISYQLIGRVERQLSMYEMCVIFDVTMFIIRVTCVSINLILSRREYAQDIGLDLHLVCCPIFVPS